ncbi:DUF2213 domain-containing protein [Leptospira interrogans]|uniref:PF09979 family protein n=4 Tax=Leptospira interrogans TaxID=173 RepID=A0A0E2D371_LEPIR|nr:DUF2213 domain-containing protein [Leptospira interrogans]EKR54459.1 PF09979 family protein [Leptospira interrogans str. UI 12758]
MQRVTSFDTGEIEVYETDEGFLRARVTIARTGVFLYLRDGKVQREAKLPEELFKKSTIDSCRLKPVTDGHPPLNDCGGLITPANYQKYTKGTFGDTVEIVSGDRIQTTEMVYDESLMFSLRAGEKRQVSVGFESWIDKTPGLFPGTNEPYDAVQRDIAVNHLSHVPQGKGGKEVKIHLDSSDEIGYMIQEETMDKVIKKKPIQDGAEDVADQSAPDDQIFKSVFSALQNFFTKFLGEANAVTPVIDDKKTSELQSQIDALKKENEELKKKGETNVPEPNQDAALDNKIKEAADARIKLIDSVKAVVPELRTDGLSDREIRLKATASILPDKKIAQDASDEAVSAVFETALEVAQDKFFLDRPDKASSVRIDEATLDKLRVARLDMREVK